MFYKEKYLDLQSKSGSGKTSLKQVCSETAKYFEDAGIDSKKCLK